MTPIELPERLNAATALVDSHLDEGRADKPAILCGDRTITYRDLSENINRLGNALRELGVRMEERVAILMPDTPECAFAFFGAIKIGAVEGAALLGPLVVDPGVKGKGYGKALVGEGLARAKAQGFGLVLLVGDMTYYGQFGFAPVPPGKITLPGPVDPGRLLAVELRPGLLESAAGQIKAHAPNL